MAKPDIVHPGVTVRENCLDRFNLSVTEGAVALGISRQTLTNLLSGKAGVSPEMALRLSRLFGNSSEFWLNAQRAVDLWDAAKTLKAQVKRLQILFEQFASKEAVFVVALPVAAMSRSVKQTAKVLVLRPAHYTFTRPIGEFDNWAGD